MSDIRKELEMIAELMGQLRDEMQYDESELGERLGRKPKAVAVELEVRKPEEGSSDGLQPEPDDQRPPIRTKGDEPDDAGAGMDLDEEGMLAERLRKLRA